MSTTALPTPADLTITPRDRKFERGELNPRLWHGGNATATAIYNALSTTFPAGEAFFVESVRRFREGAPPKLAAEIMFIDVETLALDVSCRTETNRLVDDDEKNERHATGLDQRCPDRPKLGDDLSG